jgi:hypothetical protein
MRLGRYFTLEEFTHSQTAVRNGWKNEPGPEAVEHLRELCLQVLDPVREGLGPVFISSGYRSFAVNQARGGARRSQHLVGEAADIIVPGRTAQEVCSYILRRRLPFDQLIYEGTWVHVSHRKERNRGELLRAIFRQSGTDYVPFRC